MSRACPAGAALGLALLAAGCSGPPAAPGPTGQERLESIIAGDGAPHYAAPGAAIAVWIEGEIVWSAAAGAAGLEDDGATQARPMSANAPVRAASISKLAAALTVQALARDGAVDLDAPLGPFLGFDLPVSAPQAVTFRSVLAHTSGICDPDVYWAPLGDRLSGLIDDGAVCAHAPGQGWTYANINYALVAQALETITGERFDQLALRHVITPLGLDAGFNGSGMTAPRRMAGATLFRRQGGVWIAQIDDDESRAGPGPSILMNDGAVLAHYEPGTNGTLFSPQGGLRAGAEDLARLAAAFLPGQPGAPLTEPVWTGEVAPGVRAWGSGPQILQPGQVPGRPALQLVGHGGEAYGLYGGAWADPASNAAVAFFVTGTDPAADARRDPVSGLTWWEDRLLGLALDQLDEHLQRPRDQGSAP